MSIARILAAHLGTTAFYQMASPKKSAVETADLSRYSQIQRSIMNELYGKKSFLYEYVRGEVSADACAIAITNWDLCARQCTFAAAGETEPERLARVALGVRYREAITQLQGDIKGAYVAAIHEANQTISSQLTKTIDKFIARKNVEFWEKKREEVVQSFFTELPLVANARELDLLKPEPLFARKYAERYEFWNARIDGDIIATMFRLAKGKVDLRTLFGRVDWTQVWGRKLVATMDCMHRKVINIEMLIDSISMYSTDPQYCASPNVSLDRAGLNTTIRSFEKMVKEPAEKEPADTWKWMNISVIQATRKRGVQD
ncbi:hypothetical protein ACET3X_005234 [Alternaria dauci]|uniref:Uncharacterized protein n=1 Tax=Alternaria dauci TaxID=48095 RepID=A0ABR3ULJ7_9PLEO